MWELYLISRIGVIHGVFLATTVMSITAAITCYILSVSTDDWSGKDLCNEWEKSKLRKFANKMFIVFGFSVIVTAITPTKEEVYFIYGVGSTLDYIQSNPKAKQIPDKCIEALNQWVDNLNEKEERK